MNASEEIKAPHYKYFVGYSDGGRLLRIDICALDPCGYVFVVAQLYVELERLWGLSSLAQAEEAAQVLCDHLNERYEKGA